MIWDDQKIVVATISAVVSVITVLLSFLLKSLYERHFHIFKLYSAHNYEQKKRIKEVVAKNKIQLLDAAESLNHRLWNLRENHENNWHKLDNLNSLSEHYYLSSFAYRLLYFMAWVRKTEKEMIFLDGTIAEKEDISFVKYLKIFPQILCDVRLFDGLDYNKEFAKDHFFKDDLLHACECFVTSGEVISFSEYKNDENGAQHTSLPIVDFVNGISPTENRLRWERLQALHVVLMMFLNGYGYDYQHTSTSQFEGFSCRITDNLKRMLERYRMTSERSIKNVLNVL